MLEVRARATQGFYGCLTSLTIVDFFEQLIFIVESLSFNVNINFVIPERRLPSSKEVIYPSSMYNSLAQGYLCSHFSFGNHNNKYPHEFQKLIHVPRDARPNIIVIYVLLAVYECSNCFKLSASHVKRIV